MKKEYMTPQIEEIRFYPEDELMGILNPGTGVEEVPTLPWASMGQP